MYLSKQFGLVLLKNRLSINRYALANNIKVNKTPSVLFYRLNRFTRYHFFLIILLIMSIHTKLFLVKFIDFSILF